MELRHLRYFVAVAEASSMTKAAERLRLAQPSLTRQIHNLEKEIGVALFDRSHNRLILTNEGQRFLIDARQVLALCAESVANLQRMKQEAGAHLNVGYIAGAQDSVLPATLDAFRKLHPKIGLNLFDMTVAEQVEALLSSTIDVGFIGLNPDSLVPGLTAERVTSDTMVAALPSRHPLARNAEVALSDLATHFFISMSARTHPGLREWLVHECRLSGFESRILQEADTDATAIKFVAGGLGVALLPAQAMTLPHEGVIFRPISPLLYRPAVIAWRRDDHSELLRDYVAIVRKLAHRATGDSPRKSPGKRTLAPKPSPKHPRGS